MAIRLDRIRRDIQQIARITETPGRGATRPTFTRVWREARDYIWTETRKIGCVTRIDAAGNMHSRPAATAGEPVWLSGSHIDSVPNGGNYDGVVGIVCALEVLRSANDDKRGVPLELINFAEEEGPTFGLGMLGSRAWVGELGAAELGAVRNRDGKNYLLAGKAHRVNPKKLKSDRLKPSDYLGLIEVHIEQGPGMWRRKQSVAVVTAIAGRRQYTLSIEGQANHAGSTSMQDRCDALAAAAEIICLLEDLPSWDHNEVLTVGRIQVEPNAVNVIPGKVELTIDYRAPEDALLETGDSAIRAVIKEVCKSRKLKFRVDHSENQPAAPMDEALVQRLSQAARRHTGKAAVKTISGALHDSAILAPHIATAMLFVASRDGISHDPAEFSRIEDIALAAKVLEEVVSS